VVVELQTPAGEICIELLPEAPGFTETVPNFLGYVNRGDYEGTFVHRSVPGFVVQGGGFAFDESGYRGICDEGCTTVDSEFAGVSALLGCGPGEAQACNVRGSVAMAKLGGDPDSATSQWFINLADNPGLDTANGGFTVFGRVVDMAVVDAIAGLPRVDSEFVLRTPLRSAFSELPLTGALPPSCFDLADVALVLQSGSCGQSAVPEPDPLLGIPFYYFVAPSCFEAPAACSGAAEDLDVCEIVRIDSQLFFRGTPPIPSTCGEREASDLAQADLAEDVSQRLVLISDAFVVPEPRPARSGLSALATLALLAGWRSARRGGAGDPRRGDLSHRRVTRSGHAPSAPGAPADLPRAGRARAGRAGSGS
jgi:cyclophilin family peptidyl-prolyl cis-trans isomerase